MAAGQPSCHHCFGSGWVTVNGQRVPCGFYGAGPMTYIPVGVLKLRLP